MTPSWYDYPQYYDLLFRSETQRESDFLVAAAQKYCCFPVRRLLEPACGSGRLVEEFARRGFDVTGFDLSEPALAYARRRLQRRRLKATIFQADMAKFHLDQPADAAYCTISTFRHLLTEDAARAHLQCVAQSLRPGGIYILAFHLLPPDADEECIERWIEWNGDTKVCGTLRVLNSSRRRRLETIRISLLVRRRRGTLRMRSEFPLRIYTAAQFRHLLAKVPELELCDVFDFWYDIEEPLPLNNDLADAVFVLRRKEN